MDQIYHYFEKYGADSEISLNAPIDDTNIIHSYEEYDNFNPNQDLFLSFYGNVDLAKEYSRKESSDKNNNNSNNNNSRDDSHESELQADHQITIPE